MARTNITGLPTSFAVYNPSEVTTFSAIEPGASATYTVFPLPRKFKPGFNTSILFPLGLFAGLSVSQVLITGSALVGYTATYTLSNSSASVITPTTQAVVIYQVA